MTGGLMISLKVAGRTALVAGGGPVAARKAEALLQAGARVRVISPTLAPALEGMAAAGRVEWVGRGWQPGDTEGAFLVLAATGSPAVDAAVAAEAEAAGRLFCVAGEGERGSFAFTAEVRRGPLTVAVSTGGASPALAARVRQAVEGAVGPEYGELATLMAELRDEVKAAAGLSQAERAALFTAMVDGPALTHLARGDREAAAAALRAVLPRGR